MGMDQYVTPRFNTMLLVKLILGGMVMTGNPVGLELYNLLKCGVGPCGSQCLLYNYNPRIFL